jgi:hypothetical protein
MLEVDQPRVADPRALQEKRLKLSETFETGDFLPVTAPARGA